MKADTVETSKNEYSVEKNWKVNQNPISKQSTKVDTNTVRRSNTKDTINTD